jgi:hypothetical protein
VPELDAAAVDALAPAPIPAEGVATPLPEPKPMPDIAELEPGDVVTVDKRLVPIPVPKPKQ